MTRLAGPTTEELLRRVRQEGDFAIPFDTAIDLLSKCQRIVNAGRRKVVALGGISIAKSKLVYNLRDELPEAIDVLSVDAFVFVPPLVTRKLFKVANIHELTALDPTWFRNITGTRLEAWAQIGRDILIIYPGLTSVTSVVVKYTKLTTVFVNRAQDYNTAFELPDEDVDLALGLAEVILLTRFRVLDAAAKRLETLNETATLDNIAR